MDLDRLMAEAATLALPVGVAVAFALAMRAMLKATLARVEARAMTHAQPDTGTSVPDPAHDGTPEEAPGQATDRPDPEGHAAEPHRDS